MAENLCYNKILMIFFWEKKMNTREVKRWSNLIFFFESVLFGHILKNSAHSLFGAWSYLLVHIWFTPSEGQEGFVN